MIGLKITGGFRVGYLKATYPFATLSVSKEKLELESSIIETLTFSSEEIVSIEPCIWFPIIAQGIRINHKIERYEKKVIFWTFESPNSLIKKIKKIGFL